ncbi:MAG: hypothetical protein SFV21_03595, partial [Rhodospirillaceae bacterium]|nr:hypothetical protein [Rhodospirillaceae bacterium]
RPCPHCGGTGHVRSTESAAIYALRMIEEEGVRKRSSELTVTVHPSVALYLLNHKRSAIASMETRFALRIFVLGDEALVAPALRIDRVKMTRAAEEALAAQAAQQAATRALAPPVEAEPEDEDEPEIEDDAGDNAETEDRETDGGARRPSGRHQARDEAREDSRDDNRGEGGVRRRRRRRRRGRRDERDFDDTRGPQSVAGESQELGARAGQNADPDSGPVEIYAAPAADVADTEVEADGSDSGSGTDDRGRRRRRGRRGGRRRRREFGDNAPGSDAGDDLRDLRAPPSDETGEAIFAAPPLPAADAGPVDFIAPAASPSTGTRNDDEAGRGGAGRLFRAIRDTALSWARPEPRAEERTESRTESRPEPYDAPRAPAPESAPSPAAIVVQPEPVQPASVAREPDPAPAVRPVAPPDPPPGPPRKGWWNQAGS